MMKSFPKMLRMWAMVACLAFANAFAVTVWDGTADVSWYTKDAQSYTLTTAEQLAGLAKLVNNGNTFEGKTITLGADIFLNDTTGASDGTWASNTHTAWTPIGGSKWISSNNYLERPFKGEFDGLAGTKKHKIYGLCDTTVGGYVAYYDAYNGSESFHYAYMGLFGYIDGAKISNIDLVVGLVETPKLALGDAAYYVGGLVGYSKGGSITNVHSEVDVIGGSYVGGIVGYSTGTVTRVSVKADMTGLDTIGGIAGYIGESLAGTLKSNIYFEGSVTGDVCVGGIAGVGTNISNYYCPEKISKTSRP